MLLLLQLKYLTTLNQRFRQAQYPIHPIMTFKEILRKLNNRYVYAIAIFLVLFLFVDQFNLFEQIRLRKTLQSQKQQIEFYEKEISDSKELLYKLQNDTATMEKVARENYMMKRDNEVVYLIETQE